MGFEIDWEFVKLAVLIFVPIGVGSLLGPWVVQKLQDRNVKITRKKEIIDSFIKSTKHGFGLLDTFARRISEYYSTSINLEKYLQTKKITFHAESFPTKPDELPSKKFETKFKKLDDSLSDLRVISSHFISFARLYVGDEELIKKYLEIHSHLTIMWFMIRKLMEVKTLEDFGSQMRELSKERNETKKIIESFEDLLINIKIQNVIV